MVPTILIYRFCYGPELQAIEARLYSDLVIHKCGSVRRAMFAAGDDLGCLTGQPDKELLLIIRILKSLIL